MRTEIKRSLINKYFSKELLYKIYLTTKQHDLDNNEKAMLNKELLTEYNIPWSSLGNGTNRMAVIIDGYAVKIALDSDGMIDNRREMLYSKNLYPYVVKVYETLPNGLVSFFEYVSVFDSDDRFQNQDEMREILDMIAENFLLGDVGIIGENYKNWGTRPDGSICILDFAYIYSVNYNIFTCDECGPQSILHYDRNYDKLECSHCGRKYSFSQIRKRITKAKQEEEIGDIRRLGYNITKDEEEVEYEPTFEPKEHNKKAKKELTEDEKILKEIRKGKKKNEYKDYWD